MIHFEFFNFLAAYGLWLYLSHLSLIFFIMIFDRELLAPQPVRINAVIHCMLYLLAVNAASILLLAVIERYTAAMRNFVFARLINPRLAL